MAKAKKSWKQRKKFDARKRYEPKVKAAFLKATRDARAGGKTWAQAFTAARRAGYTGTLAGIEVLVRMAGGGKARRAAKKVSRGKGSDAGRQLRPVFARAAKELRKLAAQLDGIVW